MTVFVLPLSDERIWKSFERPDQFHPAKSRLAVSLALRSTWSSGCLFVSPLRVDPHAARRTVNIVLDLPCVYLDLLVLYHTDSASIGHGAEDEIPTGYNTRHPIYLAL